MVENHNEIRKMVKERFARIAKAPETEKRFPIGAESAKGLGYATQDIESLPTSVTESFAGVGNPLLLGPIHEGETILDLGVGAGFDSFIAAQLVGPSGKVIGIDMTEEMLTKAEKNRTKLGLKNVEFRKCLAEEIPLEDESVDVIISNGVFNLCPEKEKVLAEAYRVLKAGGRFQIADISLEDGISHEEVAKLGTWSD
ncbi:MAG: methyltransferase domain-containing protein [Nitrospinae bacterium]|nr:methyltransferase domain-containing protein [Nitrospinota bacterium]